MLLAILGIVDMLGGITMLFPNFLAFYIGVIILLKGISSMLSLVTGNLVIIILGIVDIIAGLMLIFSFSLPFIWLILIVKGFFSLVSSLGR